MSALLVARHAQASFLADDYERLSPLGERQARVLEPSWVVRNGETAIRALDRGRIDRLYP